MDLELRGKSVLITGGARGIGFACAQAFAQEGARIAILDWNGEALTQAADSLAVSGAEIITRQVDVSDAAAVDAAHAEVIAHHGAIDIGFNNAGINTPFRAIEDTDEADWDRVIGVNLKGLWLCVRAQVRHMRPRGQGAIINTASNVAFAGAPGASAYVAAKHGIVGITRTVALELAGTGIRVNAIAPGGVSTILLNHGDAPPQADPFPTAMIRQGLPIGRWGEPAEVADAVLWLASPRASFAHGETLVIDGGFLAQ